MENQIPFNEALFSNAGPVMMAWLYWMTFALVVPTLIMLLYRETRRDAVVATVANVLMLWGMSAIYDLMGFVRLMGVVHVITWTPLFIYFFFRLRNGDIPRLGRISMIVLMATIGISLVFDYTDTIRYILGERASMI